MYCFVAIVLCCYAAFCGTLDCMFYKVGQANFVLLTHNSNALVVDCGVGGGYGRILGSKSYMDDICCRLQNVNKIKIVVTHNHKDHYSSINRLLAVITRINQVRALYSANVIDFDMNRDTLLYGAGSDYGYVVEFLSGSLGDDVQVVTFVPWFDGTLLNQNDPHQANLVLVVSYNEKSILLPGDADSCLFSFYCLHQYQNSLQQNVLYQNLLHFHEIIRKCNVVLLPHHGSWQNGEQFWIYDALWCVDKSKLYIISSDPEYDSNLPKREYIEKIIGYIGRTSALHGFHCNGQTSWICNNLFITSSARSPCYKISISPQGIVLTDGNDVLLNCI